MSRQIVFVTNRFCLRTLVSVSRVGLLLRGSFVMNSEFGNADTKLVTLIYRYRSFPILKALQPLFGVGVDDTGSNLRPLLVQATTRITIPYLYHKLPPSLTLKPTTTNTIDTSTTSGNGPLITLNNKILTLVNMTIEQKILTLMPK